jgi:hypothetical protein
MDDLGACYAVLLHEPAARRGLGAGAGRPAPAGRPLRRALARALRALATRLEPVPEPAVLPPPSVGGTPLALAR